MTHIGMTAIWWGLPSRACSAFIAAASVTTVCLARSYCWSLATSTMAKRPTQKALPTPCCTWTRTGWSASCAGCLVTPPIDCVPAMSMTVGQSPDLIFAIASTFQTLHQQELRIVRQTALDYLLSQLTRQMHWRKRTEADPRMPQVARLARDYLHTHLTDNVSLTDLANLAGVDRFRLNRAFKAAFGLAPHAYLVQLRLAQARRRLAAGDSPSAVAMDLGFADQSHLGRWFKRAYGLTPAGYRQRCTHLPDGL